MTDQDTVNEDEEVFIKIPKESVLNSKPVTKLDTSAFFGLIVSIAIIVIALSIGGKSGAFFDIRSVLIVVFGTLIVTAVSFDMKDCKAALPLIGKSLFHRETSFEFLVKQLLELSLIVRTKGFLELAKYDRQTRHDVFLNQGCKMLIDGATKEEIQKILGQEIDVQTRIHYKGAGILRKAAEVSPAMGLIGTLIGLVQMLSFLDDPSMIGPSMAVALLTTFYGAFLSTVVFSPLAGRIEHNAQNDAIKKRLTINALLSMIGKENPRRLEIVLNSILPPEHRVKYFD